MIRYILSFLFISLLLTQCNNAPKSDAEWDSLQKILIESTGIFGNDERPAKVPTTYLTDAPILGNGDIGLVQGGNDRQQTLYFNRNDNWAWALGGVTLSCPDEGAEGSYITYEQNIESSFIRGDLNINGNPVQMETWVAINDPIAITTISNNSGQSFLLDVKTWTRPSFDKIGLPLEGKPFYLIPWNWPGEPTLSENTGSIEAVPFSYKDGTWPIPEGYNDVYWKIVSATENTWYIENYTTGNYLAADDEGSLIILSERSKDHSDEWEFIPTYMGFRFLNKKLNTYIAHDGDIARVYEVESDKTEHRSWLRKTIAWQFQYPEGVLDTAISFCDEDMAWAYRENSRENYLSRATITTKIQSDDVISAEGVQRVLLEPHSTVNILISVDGEGGAVDAISPIETYLKIGKERILSLNQQKIEELNEERIAWWKSYWLKSWVDFGNDRFNKYWYGAYHALACASRPGYSEMPSLWGAWVTIDNPSWGNDHYNNYNHISPYYGIYSGNRFELLEPYIENQLNYLPYYKNTTALAGYQGVIYPRVTNRSELLGKVPDAIPVAPAKNRDLLPNDQLDAALFIAFNLFFYYEYTLDVEFLYDKAYPLAIECVNFFEDYLQYEEDRYVLYRSGAREGTIEDTNAGFHLAYIKRLCEFLIETSKVLDKDDARREKWQHMIDHMSDYPTAIINGKTVFKEAENREEIGLRDNGVHDTSDPLQVVFPGEQISIGSDSCLLQIALNTWDHLNSRPDLPGWIQTNNFPKALPQVVRMGWEPERLYDELYESLDSVLRNNLTVFIFGGGIENCGATEAFNSMLLQSHEDAIRLFPVWPSAKDVKFNHLRTKGAFLVSSELLNSVIQYVEIESEKGGDLHLMNPWLGSKISLMINDQKVEIESSEILSIKTSPGDKILFRSERV